MSQTHPNALYALLGVDSAASSEDSARTVIPLGSHLRHRGGLFVTALGLAAEHGTAQFAFHRVGAVPISMSLHQRHIHPEAESLEVLTRMRHQGRQVMVTSFDAYATADRTTRWAYGSITWSVLPPFAPRDSTAAPGFLGAEGTLGEIAGVALSPDGDGSIEAIRPGVAGPGGILHAGALQILAERVALAAAAAQVGRTAMVADAEFHFIRAVKHCPVSARPTILCRYGNDGADVEVEMTDIRGRTCAIATCRVRA